MVVKLYYMDMSPPCRTVILTATVLGLKMELKKVNLWAGEHKTADFLKLNPDHCLPTIDDDGFVLWESRAIATYLVGKYGKPDDALYPKDLQKRAGIDRLLYFDSSSLSTSIFAYYSPQWFAKKPPDSEKEKKMKDQFMLVESHLEGKTYLTGDTLTLADLCIVSSILQAQSGGSDFTKYHNISSWIKHISDAIPEFEYIKKKGADEFAAFVLKNKHK